MQPYPLSGSNGMRLIFDANFFSIIHHLRNREDVSEDCGKSRLSEGSNLCISPQLQITAVFFQIPTATHTE